MEDTKLTSSKALLLICNNTNKTNKIPKHKSKAMFLFHFHTKRASSISVNIFRGKDIYKTEAREKYSKKC